MKNKTQNNIKWENKKTEELFRAILLLKNKNEVKNFFRDLMTENEIVEFGNRLKAAEMLKESFHYAAITEETGLSSRTIARVKKWYKTGRNGYRTVLSRLKGRY